MINIEDFWEDAKNELSISIQAISYEVWIEKLEPVCFVDNAIVLSTISANAKRTIDTRYRDTIKEVVSSLNSSITDVIITTPDGTDIMVRQVAGAMARRIVTYAREGEECYVDEHLGFIKFGSRVDLYLPLNSDVLVSLGQKTVGNETIIARLNPIVP